MDPRRWLAVGSLLAGLAVAAGAFGAHGLRDKLSPRDLEVFETAVRYQMFHALALGLVGVLARVAPQGAWSAAGWCFAVGVVLFSGSLYALVGTGVRKLGMVTPLGGVAFLVGWALLARAAWSAR